MNENNFPVINDSDVGMDPSIVTTIETLDVLPPDIDSKKTKKKNKKKKYTTVDPDKKPHDKLKKLLFTLIVVLLMYGVGFGVYYYLSLGKTEGGISAIKQLDDKNVYVGYGLDSIIDMSGYDDNCKLDTSKVNTNEIGVYKYTIKCSGTTFEGNINVIEMEKIDYRTHLVYASDSSSVTADMFVSSNNSNYSYSFSSENVVSGCFESPGGICPVEIIINDSSDNSIMGTFGHLVVVENKPKMYMNCSIENEVNQFLFDDDNNDMKNGIVINKKTFSEEEFYYNLSQVVSGKVVIDGEVSNVIYNPSKLEIYYFQKINYDILLDQEEFFPSTYSEIESYYKDMDYKCSLSFKSGI